jgi:putative transposase
MARLARVVIPGIPYHLTHRGNRRADVFYDDQDRWDYLHDLAATARRYGLAIWGWCLMSNHVHLLGVPRPASALAATIRLAHARHARRINAPRGWTGHLWASRFFSTALDGAHLWTAIRYVELNPVRAGLAARAEDYAWSSARAHARGAADPLLDPERPFVAGARDPLTGRPLAWSEWLARGLAPEEADAIRQATRTGRPLDDEAFVRRLEMDLARPLAPQKPGPKPKNTPETEMMDLFEQDK